MYTVVLGIHVTVAAVLIGIILIQRGRSSGLIEAMGGVESIFGTKTSSLFVRATVILSVVFFLTSMSLAYLSKQRSASLLEKISSEVATSGVDESQTPEATAESEGPVSSSQEDDAAQAQESPQNVEVNEEKTE